MAVMMLSTVEASLGGDIILHDMPPLPPRYQMEADNVPAVEAESCQIEVLCVAVEYRDAVAQRSWLCCRHNLIHSWIPRKNFPNNLHILEDAKFGVTLRRPT